MDYTTWVAPNGLLHVDCTTHVARNTLVGVHAGQHLRFCVTRYQILGGPGPPGARTSVSGQRKASALWDRMAGR
eukprot:25833-Pyramimonas_sp.AAC.1